MMYKSALNVVSKQGSTANWDMNAVFYPDAIPTLVHPVSRYPGTAGAAHTSLWTSTGAPSGAAGGVTAYQGVAGTNLSMASNFDNVCYVPSTVSTFGGSNVTTVAVQGSWRLSSLGMEIVNTTAPLYRGGAVTVWMQPVAPPIEASTITIVDSSVAPPYQPLIVSNILSPAPPFNIAEANVLGGSRQWAAEEGAYLVARSSSDSIPIINNQLITTAYYPDSPDDTTVYAPYWNNVNTGPVGPPTQLTSICPCTAFNPYNQMGAYFTGLTAQSTFTINIWAFIEVFPDQISNVLTPLAQPSAPYDEQALRLVSELIKSMPVGVMLKENGLGEWLSNIADKAINMVGGVASLVKRAAGAVTTGVEAWNTSGNATLPQMAMSVGSDVLRSDGLRQQRQRQPRQPRPVQVVEVVRPAAPRAPAPSRIPQLKSRLPLLQNRKR
jgi:hypothetical protein